MNQPTRRFKQWPMLSIETGRSTSAACLRRRAHGWAGRVGIVENPGLTANASSRRAIVRPILESIRRAFPLTAAEVSPFVRGMTFMFWVYTVALIVSTILGMRANGQL